MKRNTTILLGIMSYFLCFMACNVQKKSSNDSSLADTCETKAKVLDYTNLDGCSYLLQLYDKTILYPYAIIEEGKSLDDLKNARTVMINYKEKNDVMTTCMKGTIIEISCCTIIESGAPDKGE